MIYVLRCIMDACMCYIADWNFFDTRGAHANSIDHRVLEHRSPKIKHYIETMRSPMQWYDIWLYFRRGLELGHIMCTMVYRFLDND